MGAPVFSRGELRVIWQAIVDGSSAAITTVHIIWPLSRVLVFLPLVERVAVRPTRGLKQAAGFEPQQEIIPELQRATGNSLSANNVNANRY
jgi:hypothetical protein